CGIVRQGGEVWHFLQSNLFRQQGKWFNRNQIRKKEAYARRGSSPVNFWEAGVYIDSLDGFLKRGSDYHRKAWPTIKVFRPL
ncbi:MAG: hypothetical protein ABIQ99_13640, partial [Thermoflexales bacterium]